MQRELEERIEAFAEEHHAETLALLKELAAVPAPSNQEQKRAAFVREWLLQQGARKVWADRVGNVIFRYGADDSADTQKQNLTVIIAHMDVVFSDREALPVYEKDGKLFAPGVGDNTANLVNMLMAIKFLLQYPVESEKEILFVANVGEEGLGNLRGSREIMADYGGHIREWVSLDLYYNVLYDSTVGSQRYKIGIRTRGGHSYKDFGEENAIAGMAEIITDLYRQDVPQDVRTTYNVGGISGGTSINTIAQEAVIYYEFRSQSAACMKKMEASLQDIVDKHRRRGKKLEIEVLGIRPGAGDVDKARQQELKKRCLAVMQRYYEGEIHVEAASTDSNIPFSCGIPAVTVGTVLGGLLHTREEWIDMDSMRTGQKIAIGVAVECL